MCRLLAAILVFAFIPSAVAYQRIVLLAPAAGDILIQLGAADKVVGVTRNNFDFPKASKIGSHIKPNLELIKGLKPDLLIISSNRFFSQQMAGLIDAQTWMYNPLTLDDILLQVQQLGELTERQQEAAALSDKLTRLRASIKPLKLKPKVVFEVTEHPFMIAGKGNIVNSIISAAGGELFAPSPRKIAKFNIESILFADPDYYIYQIGPMNKNPTPPARRTSYQVLHSQYIQVDQLSFSRANTASFYHALALNQAFAQH